MILQLLYRCNTLHNPDIHVLVLIFLYLVSIENYSPIHTLLFYMYKNNLTYGLVGLNLLIASDNDKLKPLEPEYSFCAPVVPGI